MDFTTTGNCAVHGLVAFIPFESGHECYRCVAELNEIIENKKRIDEMVDRFLSWPLPDSVCADVCASTPGYKNRVGTNLLTADEARQMLEYVLNVGPTNNNDKKAS